MQTSCVKRIHLVTDDGLHAKKAFYKVKIAFIHPLWMIANLSVLLRNVKFFILCTLGMPDHVNSHPPKKKESKCREHWCLSGCKNTNLSLASFIRYWNL